MHKLLHDLLQKRKLKLQDLRADERAQFEQWQSVFEEEVTVEKVVEFCEIMQEKIEAQWDNLDNKRLKNERLVIMHTVYGKILKMLRAKKTERDSVEKELRRLLDTPNEPTV